ncbi:hypothetical protein DY000_02008244 [Brassica cretica]|uniref:Uncharacterized protein n=1 Tax=Brassica cretica TaxID=69181 RepID=A0ABQ7BUP4_BRACR|nr:hypothetical protein DY000_02008244 [Brassica cretica]
MACGGVVPSSGVRTGLSLAREDSWSRRCEELSMLRLQLSGESSWFLVFSGSRLWCGGSPIKARRGIGIGVSACLRSFNPSQWQYAWNSTIPVPNNGFPDLFGRLYSLILIAGMVSRPSIVNRASETTTACARRRVGATNSPRSNPDEMVTMEGSGVAPNNLAHV